jgi:hypothetical protein
MVAVKANPNGWYPETWGSTLEAEMEVVIQMEHCGLVTFFTCFLTFLRFFFTLHETEVVIQMEHCGLVRLDSIFTRRKL